MKQPAGFIIDVPVTLSVAVRGEGLTKMQAMAVARDYAHSLAPSQNETDGYNWAAFGHPITPDTPARHFITEVSLESSMEDACEVIDELEPEDE